MAEKFIFSMQVFFLGFSVVMVVLFALYGLTVLFNRFSSRFLKKEEQGGGREVPDEGLSPQLAAAIAAAVNCHRTAHSTEERGTCLDSGHAGSVRIQVNLPEIRSSRWLAAGRKDLLENSRQLEFSRGKRT